MRQKFTSKERDIETGLDYFGARYYANVQGRFTSVDPISITIDRLFDPQRLNGYVYVRDNPGKHIDPDGKDIRIDPKLSPADADKLIKLATSMNLSKLGHDTLVNWKESKMTFEFTIGDTTDENGTHLSSTGLAPFGVSDPKTGHLVSLDLSKSNVIIKIDIAALESNNKNPDMEEVVPQDAFNHEISHANDFYIDPIAAYNMTLPDGDKAAVDAAESRANGFRIRLGAAGLDTSRYPTPESLSNAENDTKKLFGLPTQPPPQSAPQPRKVW